MEKPLRFARKEPARRAHPLVQLFTRREPLKPVEPEDIAVDFHHRAGFRLDRTWRAGYQAALDWRYRPGLD